MISLEEVSDTEVKVQIKNFSFTGVNEFKKYLIRKVKTYAISTVFINSAPLSMDNIITRRIGLIPLFKANKGDYIILKYTSIQDEMLYSNVMKSHAGTEIPSGVQLFPLRKGDEVDIFCTISEGNAEVSPYYIVINRVVINEIIKDYSYELNVFFIDRRYNKEEIIRKAFQEVKNLYY